MRANRHTVQGWMQRHKGRDESKRTGSGDRDHGKRQVTKWRAKRETTKSGMRESDRQQRQGWRKTDRKPRQAWRKTDRKPRQRWGQRPKQPRQYVSKGTGSKDRDEGKGTGWQFDGYLKNSEHSSRIWNYMMDRRNVIVGQTPRENSIYPIGYSHILDRQDKQGAAEGLGRTRSQAFGLHTGDRNRPVQDRQVKRRGCSHCTVSVYLGFSIESYRTIRNQQSSLLWVHYYIFMTIFYIH